MSLPMVGEKKISLSMDLIEQVLIRLPVKSLQRFKFVAKSWSDSIENPSFVKQHLTYSITTGVVNQFPVGVDNFPVGQPKGSKGKIYALDSKSFQKLDEIETPLNGAHVLLNTCNGLILVHPVDTLSKNHGNGLVIFNPSSREGRKGHFVLPDAHSVLPPAGNRSICLGYDPLKDDYKVFIINSVEGKDSQSICEAAIYSTKLESNGWRIEKDFAKGMNFSGSFEAFGFFVASGEGTLFAINKFGSTSYTNIVALDVATEKFNTVPMPDFKDKIDLDITVHVFDGSLALICNYPERTDFWVMDKYGVKDSWSMLLSVKLDGPYPSVIPLVYSKCRTEVLLGSDVPDQQLLWYNLMKKTVRSCQVSGLPTNAEFFWVCMESLVSVEGTGKISEKEKQIEEEK